MLCNAFSFSFKWNCFDYGLSITVLIGDVFFISGFGPFSVKLREQEKILAADQYKAKPEALK